MMETHFSYDCTPRFVYFEYKFTGKERDPESGLDYFGTRYYASSMGRFMSPDWSAKEEPVPYAKLGDPQSLNLYAYVRNNPLSKTDPNGHCIEDACIIEGAIAKLGTSSQITDLINAAGKSGSQFSLYLGEKTQLTKPLASQLYNSVRQYIASPTGNLST